MTSTPARPPLPFVVILLALGTFLMNTTEFVIAGLLPDLAADLQVSEGQAGLMITAFAVGMIVGAPTISVLTARMPKRLTLVLALVIFAAGHVIAAVTPVFAVVLVARIITAVATGAYLSLASIVATTAAGPAAASRAMGVMMTGLGLAIVAGVPLGSFAGQAIGWRGIFLVLAVLAVIAAVVIGLLAPRDSGGAAVSLRSQLGVLGSGNLWLVLTATAFVSGGLLAVYSYVSPLLVNRAGVPLSLVPLVLVGFGIGAIAGTLLAGRLADRAPLRAFAGIGLGTLAVVALLLPLGGLVGAVVPLVVLLGLTGMGVATVAIPLAVRFGSAGPALAAALAVSSFNVGIALGTSVAGATLNGPLGATGPQWVALPMLVVGLAAVVALGLRRATAVAAPAVTDVQQAEDLARL